MTITKQFNKLDKSRVKLDVTIPKEEVAKAYEALLAKYARSIQIPGFRRERPR
jgi:trigger factor